MPQSNRPSQLWKRADDKRQFDPIVATPAPDAPGPAAAPLDWLNPYTWGPAADEDKLAMANGLQRHVIDPARLAARAQAQKAGGFGKGPVDPGT